MCMEALSSFPGLSHPRGVHTEEDTLVYGGCKDGFSKNACLAGYQWVPTKWKALHMQGMWEGLWTDTHVIQHQRTHTGKKLYTCWQCGQAFSKNSCLVSTMHPHR